MAHPAGSGDRGDRHDRGEPDDRGDRGEEADDGRGLPALPRRVGALLLTPSDLFAALRDDPRWLGALVLGVILVAVTNTLIPTELYEETFVRIQLESGDPTSTSVDAHTVATVQKWSLVIATVLFWPIVVTVFASIVTVIFGLLLGDRADFRQYLSVVAHASLVLAIGGLLVLPLRVIQRDFTATLNLGLFLPFEEGMAADFFRAFDLFLIWFLVLVGIGAHQLDERRGAPGVTLTLLVLVAVVAGIVAWLLN